MLRSLLPVVLVVSSGCTLHHARLDSSRDLVLTRTGDGVCGPIGIRRASLGARWGEYVRVSVTSPTPVSGEARLHVDGRAYPLQRFTTAQTLDAPVQVAVAVDQVQVELPAVIPVAAQTQTIVLDAAWTNERLDVPAALGAGHVIDITLAGLTTTQGSCKDVVFTVEQGLFRPTVDERLWIAELTRRGGPELQAWLAAEEARKAEIRAQVFAEAERRKAEWLVQVEARREAARVEAIAQAEAVRVEVAAKVEAERVEAVRREEVRQAHYAEYERRREAKVEVGVSAVAVAPVAPAPKRALVCRAPVASPGVFSGAVASGPVSSVPMAAEESCEEVTESVSGGAVAASSVNTNASGVLVTETSVGAGSAVMVGAGAGGAVAAGSASGSTVVAAGIGASGGMGASGTATGVNGGGAVVETVSVSASGAVGGNVTLQAENVSSETVAAAPAMEVEAYPEWSTPSTFTTARVAVTTEQVTPVTPCPPPAPQPQVTVVDPTPGLVLLHLFGAVVNAAVNARPVHAATPVNAGAVSYVRPVPPPPPANARPAVSPPPPAPR